MINKVIIQKIKISNNRNYNYTKDIMITQYNDYKIQINT